MRRFAQEQIAPRAAQFEAARAYPKELFQDLADLGLMGMTLDADYGGSKTDYMSYALALIEVAAADGGLSTILSVHNSLTGLIIANEGSEEQKERFLPKLASGEWIGGFALTEPHAGSDAASLKVRARKDGDTYVLSGAKQFITSGQIAGLMIVFAVTDPEAGRKGISCFAVETDRPGYTVTKVEDKLGQKASDTCAISFDNLVVPAANRLGAEGEGYKIALSNLETGRVGIAAQSVGMARAALDLATDYAKERESFGVPIVSHQAVSFRLADLATKLEAARLMVLNVAALKDQGVPCLKEACMAKLFASEVAEEICSGAIQTLGGYGYLSDYPLEKIYRDVRVCQIYEGTSDIQKLIISRAL
ncbi:MAG: acyl-CoA dehydrogenase [Alphaproteobacteria bacterium]|nr:MAG: acyl-CoA dehydrogenase [Alphaproteobacteria bacterium]